MVVVEEANSIIFCGFSTALYDIQFGFYRVSPDSELHSEDDNQHVNLEEIYMLTKIDSYPNPVKVSFIAKEPGIYKILWSNNHSWFKAKTLRYKISVLKPGQIKEDRKEEPLEESKEEPGAALNFSNKMTTSKKIALQKLLEIPSTVIQTFTNINASKKREMQTLGWEEQLYFLQLDPYRDLARLTLADQGKPDKDIEQEMGGSSDLPFLIDEMLFEM
mmetsp:Transcript_10133/g.10088  ORF Transcript_10133/g.10088 Transcript_10133/m.10088 type:complete len:218 (+) Transcript_10133:917-1570(+)